MGNFKSKVLNSTFWSFFETFGNQGVQFVIGIILARLLLPEDYGIIGVLAVFMGISGVLVDSGFKSSIIRSKEINNIDCSTIFYVNFSISIIVGSLLFVSAEHIAIFFNKPELVSVTRVFALIPIINGFGLVQSALLFRNLQFKRNAKISIATNILSGGIAILLALKGFSYWALVWKGILGAGIYNLLLWITGRWHPKLVFSIGILKKHFRFSSRLLLTGIVDSFFNNIYSFIFGKFFSFKELGYFQKGRGYVDMVTKTLSITIQKVNKPLLAASGKDDDSQINYYSKLLRATTLLIFPLSSMLIAVSEPMIIFLIGAKWQPVVPFLQILAVSGMIYPVLNANSSLFEILGRSDIILKIALINRPVQIIILLIMLSFNALAVTWGILFHNIFILYLSFYFLKKATNQKISIILKMLSIPFLISVITGLSTFAIGFLLRHNLTYGFILGAQIVVGFSTTLFLFKIFKIMEFNIVLDYIYEIIHSGNIKKGLI